MGSNSSGGLLSMDNLVLIVDINGQQVEGETKKVMNIEPLEDRFTAFGAKLFRLMDMILKRLKKLPNREKRTSR
mgnify:CR=1 FL=1